MTQALSSPRPAPAKAPGAGLEGVVAAKSAICFIDGKAGKLIYRGYEIGDLVEHLSFEETAYLLWHAKLPNRKELDQLRQQIATNMALPDFAMKLLREIPDQTPPMDAMRTIISALGGVDPELHSNEPEADGHKAVRIVAQLPTIVTAFHQLRNGQEPIAPDPSLSVAGNFLYMLNREKPNNTLTRVLDAALVLHAEHGMNASTFAARVTAATLSDIHAAITAALAALKGPLHGGANQDVMELLLEADTPEKAEKKVRDMLNNGKKVAGFGHRVYRTIDPRAKILGKMSKQLGEAAGNTKWYEMSERLIPIVKQMKNKDPNVDFFSASTYYTMGIPLDLFTPMFGIARAAGWTAHVMEQHQNNRIIRPTDDYVGPMGLKTVPIEQRS